MTRTFRCCLMAVLVLGALGCSRPDGTDDGATGEQTSVPAAAGEVGTVEEQSVVPYESETLGALEVKSANPSPVDWFDVLQNGERAFAGNPKLLNTVLELPPGAYVVDVNRTQREVTLEAGKKTILWTGDLVVEGEPSHAYWYPMQGGERKLSSNPSLLNTPRALFPGTYTVYVYESVTTGDQLLGEAVVKPGETTVLQK